MKNHSDELIFHSQGLRRSAANLVIASENSPSRNSPRVSSRKALRHEGKSDEPVIPEEETVWLNQAQMVELYGRDTSVISRHIRNIFKEGELDKESNLHFLQIANSDRPVAFYSLDVIISVGYRVKSHRGIAFRKWANGVLKQYILRGYAVNENRMKQLGEVVRLMKRTQESLDSKKYGDPLGPTYEMLREKKTCKQIIESASRPIEDLDNRFTLDGFQQWYKTYKNLQSN